MSQENAKPESEPGPLSIDESRITGLKLVTIAPATSAAPRIDLLEAPEPGTIKAPSIPPPPATTPRDPYIGCTIDNRYKVESVLGEGGMGVVYECRHKVIGKKVAMKILRADLARDKEVTERFLIEARAASSIGDEHIIDISDFGQLPDGSAYFVMEFLEGHPLSSEVRGERPLEPRRIVPIGLQLARGLHAAHAANIVHRDLKPDNIYLISKGGNEDFVKILDFGIAKVSSGATSKLTQAGSVFGTPHYMSPEQAAGSPVDHRGDIYSLGIILYELACGKVPFDADNFMGILTQHMYKEPISVREKVPTVKDISPGLDAIIRKCISKRPEQRYDSMAELAEELERLRAGQPPLAIQEMQSRPGGFALPEGFLPLHDEATHPGVDETAVSTRKPASRWPVYAGLMALLVVGGGMVTLQQRGRERAAAEAAQAALAAEPPPVAVATPTPALPPTPTVSVVSPVQVVVGVEPLSAHVFVGERDLGTSPVVIPVPPGETISAQIRQDGYLPRDLALDGSEQKLSITLTPVKAHRPVNAHHTVAKKTASGGTSGKSKSKSSIGGGEIVNPWAN
jgi:eukaryotic-like serine/threonine-protein kinase